MSALPDDSEQRLPLNRLKWQTIEEIPDWRNLASQRWSKRRERLSVPVLSRTDRITHGKVISCTQDNINYRGKDGCVEDHDHFKELSSTNNIRNDQSTGSDNEASENNVSLIRVYRKLKISSDLQTLSHMSTNVLVRVLIDYNGFKRGLDTRWKHMGVETNMGYCLYPEEALLLMFLGEFRALCSVGGALTIQHAMTLLCRQYLSHRINVLLHRATLCPVKHQPHIGITCYEKKINLQQDVLRSKKSNSQSKPNKQLDRKPSNISIDIRNKTCSKLDSETRNTFPSFDDELSAFYSSIQNTDVECDKRSNGLSEEIAGDYCSDEPKSCNEAKKQIIDISESNEESAKKIADYERAKKEILANFFGMDVRIKVAYIPANQNFLPSMLKVLKDDYYVSQESINNGYEAASGIDMDRAYSPEVLDSDTETSSSSDSESVSSLSSESDQEDISFQGWYQNWNKAVYMKRVLSHMNYTDCCRKRKCDDLDQNRDNSSKKLKVESSMYCCVPNNSVTSNNAALSPTYVSSSISNTNTDSNSSSNTSTDENSDTEVAKSKIPSDATDVDIVDENCEPQANLKSQESLTVKKVSWEDPVNDFFQILEETLKNESIHSHNESNGNSDEKTIDYNNSLNSEQSVIDFIHCVRKETDLKDEISGHQTEQTRSFKDSETNVLSSEMKRNIYSSSFDCKSDDKNCLGSNLAHNKILSRRRKVRNFISQRECFPVSCTAGTEHSSPLDLRETSNNLNRYSFQHTILCETDCMDNGSVDFTSSLSVDNLHGRIDNNELFRTECREQSGLQSNGKNTVGISFCQQKNDIKTCPGRMETFDVPVGSYCNANSYFHCKNGIDYEQCYNMSQSEFSDKNMNTFCNPRGFTPSTPHIRCSTFNYEKSSLYRGRRHDSSQQLNLNQNPKRSFAKHQIRRHQWDFLQNFKANESCLDESIASTVTSWTEYKEALRKKLSKQKSTETSLDVLLTGSVKPLTLQNEVVTANTLFDQLRNMSASSDSNLSSSFRDDFFTWMQSKLPDASHICSSNNLPKVVYDVYTNKSGYSRAKTTRPFHRLAISDKMFYTYRKAELSKLLARRRHHADYAGLVLPVIDSDDQDIRLVSFPQLPQSDGRLRCSQRDKEDTH